MERLSTHVRGLASLHELLTDRTAEGDVENVSLRELLDKLTPLLKSAAGVRTIHVTAGDVSAPLRLAGSFSMLVNELVSNAAKHGRGEIGVRLLLNPDGNSATLEVTDQGPGFPEGFNPSAASNTGIELITTLSTWDLQGNVSWENRPDGGARVAVTFPVAHEPGEIQQII
jgi:two-component sensor histidine kinase